MRFETKIAIVVRADLAVWQQLNVTAFLASGVAAAFGDTIGKPYEDGSGNRYLELFRQPVLVYAADTASLGLVRERAVSRESASRWSASARIIRRWSAAPLRAMAMKAPTRIARPTTS